LVHAKRIKIVATRQYHGFRICINAFAAGDPSWTAGGTYSAPPNPLDAFTGGRVERRGER